jgi:hypothetical protein
MTLLENVEHVLEAVNDLRDLRNKLAELDEERAAVEERIRRRLGEIAGAAAESVNSTPASATQLIMGAEASSRHVSPGMTSPLVRAGMALVALASKERVLATINEAQGRTIGALDIAQAWGKSDDEATINSIRASLSRLTADGKIRKMGYGRYAALEGGAA